jgi:hypothetical protein
MLLATTACRASESFPVAHTDAIAVRVLGGKDGKPQPYAHVVLVAGYNNSDLGVGLWREEALTDGEGMVRLSNALKNLAFLRVEALKRHSCQIDADQTAFSIDRIRRDGLSAANRCGTAVVEDVPGVFTVFVKPAKVSKKGAAAVAIP